MAKKQSKAKASAQSNVAAPAKIKKAGPAKNKPAPAAKKKTPSAAKKKAPAVAKKTPTATKKKTSAMAKKAVPAAKKKPSPADKALKKPVPDRPAKKASAKKPVTPPKVEVTAPAERPRKKSKGKVLPRQFLFDLADAIKESVTPAARDIKGREVVSTAPSGDATFEIDRLGERALLAHLRSAKAPVAYYSEDAGYSTFSNAQPKHLLVVDPIDGTRAAKSGFEGCVVAIATTRVIERPTVADVDNACVVEIMGNRVFYAERGKGARVYESGRMRRPRISKNVDLESLTWSMTVPARPAELIFPTAARLIDLSSLKGGFFACNSTSFSLTRLLTNQLDACVDVAQRYLRDIPDVVRDHFINAGRGNVLGVAPYDLVASLLIAEEAGCVVTDAHGRGFEDVMLLDSTEANHQSVIAAANPELHAKLLSFFDTRIRQFERLLQRKVGR